MMHDERKKRIPSMGPEPTLVSRKEIDALYETFGAVTKALEKLNVDYIVTGGSLLGAIRQHSILFCDDDIDIAIIEKVNYSEENPQQQQKQQQQKSQYEKMKNNLKSILGEDYMYTVRPWEGSDRVRPKRMSNVFLDIFTIREYKTLDDLKNVLRLKANGKFQTDEYVQNIVRIIAESADAAEVRSGNASSSSTSSSYLNVCPFWHFDARKAIELWPKEVYRTRELFPLNKHLKFGPFTDVTGPRCPVLLLKRAFGSDCFHVYYQSGSHSGNKKSQNNNKNVEIQHNNKCNNASDLNSDANSNGYQPHVLQGGTWENSQKMLLEAKHYVPMQMISRLKRRQTFHGKESFFDYMKIQAKEEEEWMMIECGQPSKDPVISTREPDQKDNDQHCKIIRNQQHNLSTNSNISSALYERPHRTVYMDGVFDLFHIGHLRGIEQCIQLGDRIIIGVTGDSDATGYKRPPVISQNDRVAVVSAIKGVDKVICPCPLVVTEEFMELNSIDLVVHGFANDMDAERQKEFFKTPIELGKFQRISYYDKLSTTDIIEKIKTLT